MTPAFVHLRLHSEFTVSDGIVRIDQAVARAAADGMPALAVTDLANLFGMVKFYKAARGAGVKPVIGCDVWIGNESERDKPSRLLLLCRNRKGFLQLSELLTRAWLENQARGRAEIRKDWLSTRGVDGLLALSGAQAGDIGGALAQDLIALAPPPPSTISSARSRSPAGSNCRWSRPIRCSSSSPKNFSPTRRGCASPKAMCSPTSAGRAYSRRRATSSRRPKWPSCSRTSPRRSPTA